MNHYSASSTTLDRIGRMLGRTVSRSLGCCVSGARGLVMTVLLGSLQAYKLLISPLLGSRCRFHPSCSDYAQTSVRRFGPIKGSWLALRRLARCGPWTAGGIDEVPPCAHASSVVASTNEHDPQPLHIQVAVNRTRA